MQAVKRYFRKKEIYMLSKHVIDVLNFTNKRYTKNNHNLIQLCQQFFLF